MTADKADQDSVISEVYRLPTRCALTGIKIDPNDFDGEDVSQAWLGKMTHTRVKPLFWRNPAPGGVITMRHGKWKGYLRRNGKDVGLYDVTADPLEQHNLGKDLPDVAADFSARPNARADTLPRKNYKPEKKK